MCPALAKQGTSRGATSFSFVGSNSAGYFIQYNQSGHPYYLEAVRGTPFDNKGLP